MLPSVDLDPSQTFTQSPNGRQHHYDPAVMAAVSTPEGLLPHPPHHRQRDYLTSMSSDDDMLDITHTGSISESHVRDELANDDGTEENIAGTGSQYEDFHTIDWNRDIARDRMRHRYIIKKKQDSVCDLLRGAHDAWSGWLCLLLVGISSGMMAGVIDIGATWLTDLKFGICPSAFYLNKEQCCWSSNERVIDISGNCSQWVSN